MPEAIVVKTEIKMASVADAAAIADVHVQSWRQAYSGLLPASCLAGMSVSERTRQWEHNFKEGRSTVLAAVCEGRLVGWISFGSSRDSDAVPTTAEIFAFYLLAEYWSQGVGRTLWQACRRLLADRGFDAVTLWVLKENAKAMRFYQAAGFLIDPGRFQSLELAGVSVEEVRMKRELAG